MSDNDGDDMDTRSASDDYEEEVLLTNGELLRREVVDDTLSFDDMDLAPIATGKQRAKEDIERRGEHLCVYSISS